MHIKNLNSQSNMTYCLFWSILALIAVLLPVFNSWFGFILPVFFDTQYSAIGGSIPYSDANGYFHISYHFNFFGQLDSWNMRRPLNALFYAARMKMVGYDFWYAMIGQSIMCAIPFTLYLKAIHKKFGLYSALISFLYVLYHIWMFGNTTLSEILGLTLGLLSFVLLWNGWFERKHFIYNIGIAALTVALMTRAGPNFLLLGALFLVYLKPFSTSWKKDLFVSTVVFITVFIFMIKLPLYFGDPSQNAALSNFSHTLYGLVNGGKLWNYCYSDPRVLESLKNANELTHSKILYQASWECFKENPFNLVKGLILYFGVFCFYFINFFSFGPDLLKYALRVVSGVWWAYLLYRIYHKRVAFKNDFLFLAVFAFMIGLSACVVFRDGGIRPFMVAIPFLGAMISLAFAKKENPTPAKGNAIAITLLCFILGTSLVSKFVSFETLPNFKNKALQGNQMITRAVTTHPYFTVSTSNKFKLHHISLKNFKTTLSLYDSFEHDFDKILELNKNQEIVFASLYDYATGSQRLVYGDKSILQDHGKWVTVTIQKNNEISDHFWEITSVGEYK